jgi:plastocyanin
MTAVATTIAGVRLARLILPVALGLSSVLSGCGGSGSSRPPTTLGPNDIEVADFTFAPPTLTVKVGTTVTWHFDQPSAPHNVVSLTTPVLFNSGTPKGTGTYSFTFTTPGTFPYLCQIHPSMKGTIIVTP